MDSEKLRIQIERTFNGLPYPGDHNLTVHPLGLDEEFYESIKGKNWNQLDSELLRYHHDCIGVLTGKGFQYYVAAFLLEDLQKGSPISGQMIWDFSQAVQKNQSPIRGTNGKDWFDERVKILSANQRSCLVSYFRFQRELEDEEERAAIDTIIEAINEI